MTTAIRDYDALRAAIKERREALKLSLDDLAAATGLPVSRVRRIEAGHICLDPVSLPAILSALRLEMRVIDRPQRFAA